MSGLVARRQQRAVVLSIDLHPHRNAGTSERSARNPIDRKGKRGRISDMQRESVAHAESLPLTRIHQPSDLTVTVGGGLDPTGPFRANTSSASSRPASCSVSRNSGGNRVETE